MKQPTINQLIDKLGELGKQSAYYYGEYKKTEETKAAVKAELIQTLQAMDLRSAKTETFTASIASKPSIQVTHEQSVIDWLNETPEIETDAYIGLKKTEFKSLAMTLLKQTGEQIPGTELVTTESISVRRNK
jgi:hypothetical protein